MAEPNYPFELEELAALAMAGYTEVHTTGDGVLHHGVVDRMKVVGDHVDIDRSIQIIRPVSYIKFTVDFVDPPEEEKE